MVDGTLVFNAQLASHATTLWLEVFKGRPLYAFTPPATPFTAPPSAVPVQLVPIGPVGSAVSPSIAAGLWSLLAV